MALHTFFQCLWRKKTIRSKWYISLHRYVEFCRLCLTVPSNDILLLYYRRHDAVITRFLMKLFGSAAIDVIMTADLILTSCYLLPSKLIEEKGINLKVFFSSVISCQLFWYLILFIEQFLFSLIRQRTTTVRSATSSQLRCCHSFVQGRIQGMSMVSGHPPLWYGALFEKNIVSKRAPIRRILGFWRSKVTPNGRFHAQDAHEPSCKIWRR